MLPKGFKHSESTKTKMRKAHIGRDYSVIFTSELRKRIGDSKKGKKRPESVIQALKKYHTGKTISEEVREKMRQHAAKTNLGKHLSIETKNKISKSKKGVKLSSKARENIRRSLIGRFVGEKHWNWKGGITPKNISIRTSLEYKKWRNLIFRRDNWTCVWCRQKGGKINADHIKPFSEFPELRFEVENGRTLCVNCHKKTDNYAGRGRKIHV